MTADGDLHVRPLPASAQKDRKVRALVTFRPRQSRFDRDNADSGKDTFRGFYTLFWIGMGLTMLNTFYSSYKSTGHFLSLTFATLFSKDAEILALSDAVLVGSLFICVPFAQVAKRGWLPYSRALIVLQHLWQALMLGAVVKWTHFRAWPWVQSGFFVLHTLSMMMKIHSYMSVNGNMADTYWRMRRKEEKLKLATIAAAGKEKGGSEAERPSLKDKDAVREAWQLACEKSLVGPGADRLLQSTWSSIEAQEGTSALRYSSRSSLVIKAKRQSGVPSAAAAPPANESIATEAKEKRNEKGRRIANANGEPTKGKKNDDDSRDFLIRDPHPLATHPDPTISRLASEIEVMREELLSQGHDESATTERVAWPQNVTYANFWDYLLVPSLVYELEFPRTKSIRPLYVVEKVLATFGTFFVIYVITEHWIMPYQPGPDESLIGTFLQLAVPMMINYLLIFYIMFECICNGFAELTR